MLDSLMPSFTLMIGNVVLYVFLPVVLAVCIGLVWIGILRKRPLAIASGIVFAAAVAGTGMFLRVSALENPNAPASMAATANGLQFLLPYTIGVAVLVFLIRILPGLVKAHREENEANAER